MKKNSGYVSIVGAGPGDPELLTLKALRCMEKADIILYDRLVNEEILSYARPEARRIYCGKAPGVHAMTQQKIQQKLIEYAAAGHHVVRLKGGDPFVFGRGGEEALALAERGIAYEVIPGVTSAIGAGSSALIPLTHRGAAVSFACITASRKEEGGDQQEIGKLAMYVDTLVIYMGVSHISTIRTELIASGKKVDTPVAIIERGTTEQERIMVTTLDQLEETAKINAIENPALIIIGEVVKVREELLQLQQQLPARMEQIG
ncbi:uroporphyrinogen-III C-methyltransferase [Paenibacillus shunpengii]|uniref:uroporphyrinogen-III C-methyltransferase n=1 Tax=Paenibacillus shunpengii TaxID=2054424 RepID=A0ABW5SP18_9BACL